MPNITPCLWFDTQAEEAAQLYVSLFPNSKIGTTARYPEGLFTGSDATIRALREAIAREHARSLRP